MTLAALLVAGTSLATTVPRPFVVAAPLEAIRSSQAMAASPSVTGPAATRDGYTVTEAKKQAVAAGISVADTYINNPSSSVQWPFPVGVPISDYFGPRSSPGGIGSTDHKGVDFTPGEGRRSAQSPVGSFGLFRPLIKADWGFMSLSITSSMGRTSAAGTGTCSPVHPPSRRVRLL